MQPAVVSKMPPYDLRAFTFESQPHRNISFVVKVGDDDFTTIVQGLTNCDADEPHERGSIHAEGNFVGMPGINEQSDACTSLRDGFIHLARLLVSTASLNISMKQMVGYRVQNGLG